MRVAFVTEGGKEFGMGHVFRSITLAKNLGKGLDIKFFTSSGEVTINKITTEGFEVVVFKSQENLIQKLSAFNPESIVFDCLDIDQSVLYELKQISNARISLFDNKTEANALADTVINALIMQDFKNRKFFDPRNQTMFMLGPRYLILNNLFRESNTHELPNPNQITNILLAFGGSDPSNRTSYALDRILQDISQRDDLVEIDIILGPHFEYEDELEIIITKEEKAIITIHRNLTNLYSQIHKADLVLTSPGLTMFESLSLKNHVIVMYQNKLQIQIYSGLFENVSSNPDIFGLTLSGYYLNPNHDIIKSMQIAKGMEEVIEAITHWSEPDRTSSISLRQATDDDIKRILEWRSDPAVYRYFYEQNQPLSWENHLKWWKARSNRVDWIILLHENEESIPVGSVNCTDLMTDSPEIGLYVGATNHWGKSIGRESVRLTLEWIKSRGYEMARARVLEDNERSRRLFESLGFKKIGESQSREIQYQKNL